MNKNKKIQLKSATSTKKFVPEKSAYTLSSKIASKGREVIQDEDLVRALGPEAMANILISLFGEEFASKIADKILFAPHEEEDCPKPAFSIERKLT